MTTNDFFTFRRGDLCVYPGHPVAIAYMIFVLYPKIEEAFETRSGNGYANAVSDIRIPGAGGNVYQGMYLVRKLVDEPENFDEHVEAAFKQWERQLTTPCDDVYRDRLEPGNEAARKVIPELRERLTRALSAKSS